MTIPHTILFSFLGGVLPALVWLVYFLREDKKRPEPTGLILKSFMLGIAAVPIAFIFQWFINSLLLGNVPIETAFHTTYISALATLILWATVEEILKYIAAYHAGLKTRANNEPIDAIIYLITAALGFAALENMLFIFSPILEGDVVGAIITGNLRFVGATLLHISASAIVGIFVAFSFYKNQAIKKRYLFTGFVFAIALHTIFNSFIIRAEQFTLIGLATVWIVIIAIILLFERVKRIKRPQTTLSEL